MKAGFNFYMYAACCAASLALMAMNAEGVINCALWVCFAPLYGLIAVAAFFAIVFVLYLLWLALTGRLKHSNP